jgi:hypothetical protein
MNIDAGGASAPADPIVASADETVVTTPNPISTESEPAAAAPAAKKGSSIDDALDRATAKVEKDAADKDAKDPAKPLKSEQPREKGKFAAKEPAADAKDAKDPAAPAAPAKAAADPAAKPAAADAPGTAKEPAEKPAVDPNARKYTPPDRFSPDAKAAWEAAPEPVKAEVDRMHRELTQGIEKHRTAAERDGTLAEFHEMAGKAGKDLKSVVHAYVGMENLLRENPLKGLEAVCDNIGVSLREVAQIVLGQTPDQAQSQADATVREMRQEIASLKQQLGGVTQHFQQQGETQLHNQIASWAESRETYFEVIAPHIAAEMRAGATDLDDAEERVFQKHPALAALAKQAAKPAADPDPAKASAAAAADLEAQTLKGSKSITGAPGHGSNPAAKKTSKSIDEAIDRAFANAG